MEVPFDEVVAGVEVKASLGRGQYFLSLISYLIKLGKDLYMLSFLAFMHFKQYFLRCLTLGIYHSLIVDVLLINLIHDTLLIHFTQDIFLLCILMSIFPLNLKLGGEGGLSLVDSFEGM